MRPKTLKALQASIAHWEQNVAAGHPNEASTHGLDCALCGEFAWQDEVALCEGCPVKKRTGYSTCYGTPYYGARFALNEWHENPRAKYRDAFREKAQEELEFLRSLLPPGEAG